MENPTEIRIPIPGLELAAKSWGPPGAPTVLCLHGWLDNACSFDQLIPLLPALRFVALDLPGHGFSDHHPPGFPYGFMDLVGSAFHAMRALGSCRILMGHSLGAAIATALAGALPEEIERLVLIEGLGPMVEAPDDAPQRLGRALRREAERPRPPAVYEDTGAVLHRLRRAVSRIEADVATTMLSRGLCKVEGGVMWRSDSRLRWPSRLRLSEEQALAFVRAIECPTMLVRAVDDLQFMSEVASQERIRLVRDLELVNLDGSHHVHIDHARDVAHRVGPFLAHAVASAPK